MEKNKFIGFLCLIMVIVLNSSCSDNGKMKVLLENIPENADFVLVGNLKTVVESAGGTIEDSKIKLPSYIVSSLSNDISDNLDEANSFFKKAGVDTDACALMIDYKDNRPVFVFSLNDKKKFIEAIEKEDFKEKSSEDDVTFYSKKVYEGSDSDYDDYGYIAVNGSCAYWIERVWVGSDFKAIPFMQKIIEKAKESNFANTPYAEYIIGGNVGGLSISFPKELKTELRDKGLPSEIAALYNGVLCMQGDVTDNQCTVNFKWFDEDGKEVSADKFAKFLDTSATIDEKALALMGKDEFMICAMSLKKFNWDNYADMLSGTVGMSRSEKAELNAILSYFEKIDGTVAWGFGLTDGFESVSNMYNSKDPMSQFSTTIVVETKEGKAKQLIEDMKGFLEKMQIPFNDSSSGLSLNLEKTGLSGNLYVKNVDNFIVLANHPIKEGNDNELVKGTNFSDNLYAFCIGLNKNNKLMRDMDIKNNVKLGIYCKPNTMEASMILEIDGDGDGGIIAKAAKIIIKMIDQSKDFERRLNKMYSQDEEIAVDTCVVDDSYGIDAVDSVAY